MGGVEWASRFLVKKTPLPGGDRMISGKLRRKAGRLGAPASTVSVEGTEYTWSYRHGWLVWGKGLRVISLSVALRPQRTRELVLDFTVQVAPEEPAPGEARVVRARVRAVRTALEAGWDPESRGRAFRLEVEEIA
jgi:hypothetical protein